MTKLRRLPGAMPFFVAIFLNAFIDLGHKIVIQNTVYKLYDGAEQVMLTAVVNGLILLPFILLLSPAGFLSDKFRKTQVMRLSAWVVVGLCILITAFYYLGWFWAAFAMTFLLAAQSAIYSPAKYGYIKEFFGKERLGEANGVVSALSIAAILAGIFAYSILFEIFFAQDQAPATEADVIRAIAPVGFMLILNSIIELIMTYRLPEQPATGVSERFATRRFLKGQLFLNDLKPLAKNRAIRLSVIGLATFWAVGQVMLAAFPAFFKGISGEENTIVVQGILAATGIGIALGSMFAGKYSKNYIETGLLPIGALGIALGLVVLPHLQSPIAFAFNFLFVGFCGGVFIVPLNALVQYYAAEHELGKTLAANNWVQNVTMLGFLGLTALFALQGWSSKSLLQLIAVVALVGCGYVVWQLPQSLIRFLLSFLLARRYRVAVQGMKNIPAEGGVLLLGNHISWIDWAILQLACPRQMRFVMIRSIYQRRYLKWFFDLFDCIPIESGPKSRNALDQVAGALSNGEVVCLFPEGTISRTGHLTEFRKGYERACAQLGDGAVIVPFYLRGLWGSQFSRSSARLKRAKATFLRRDLTVAFGQPLPIHTPSDLLKRQIHRLSVQSWQQYIATLPSLQRAWLTAAKASGGRLAIADMTLKTELTGLQALAGSWLYARRLERLTQQQNVGLLLPTSAPGVLMNMACVLAGRTLVNLNYTASHESMETAVREAQIDTVFTSLAFLKALKSKGLEFDTALAGIKVVLLEELVREISKRERLATLALMTLAPGWLLQRLVKRRCQTDAVAAIVFSSGSEGAAKGVQLTHTNIIANVKQIADVFNIEDDDAVLANLPLFHAFGMTVTQFLPLLEGCPMVCHPDPTDAVGAARAMARYRTTLFCSTSGFLQLFVQNDKVHPLMLASLRLVVAGAEKLSEDVRAAFQAKFNKTILEGYGATETTPVASVNLPDQLETETFKIQRGQKQGSVGMPLPGSSCLVVDPQTYEPLPTGQKGLILIGGAQVMKGYLNDAEATARVIKHLNQMRWYATGDQGYLDKEGFLYMVERYSRLAKIGGEWLSLAAVEAQILNALARSDIEVLVVNIEDDSKSERLVVLYTESIDVEALRARLLESDAAPALPDKWIQIPSLPKLGSGKTDFVKAKAIAAEHH